MRWLLPALLLLSGCASLPGSTEPTDDEAHAMRATFLVWQDTGQAPADECGYPSVLRMATQGQMEDYCANRHTFACFYHYPPTIVLSESIPPDMVWASGEPVIHEMIHFLGMCAAGDPDGDHSHPGWWRGTAPSVQQRAEEVYNAGYWT